jgi:hypothetical protein
MIQATDLRIGNFIKVKTSNDNGIYIVDGIDGWERTFPTKEDYYIYHIDTALKKKARAANWTDERVVRIQGGSRDGEKFIESKLKPIPLTEEWLKRFGYSVKTEIHEGKYNYWNKEEDSSIDVELEISPNGIEANYFYKTSSMFRKQIYFVHKLQNFHYEFRNNELTINHDQERG